MLASQVRTKEDGILYLTDCLLATVSGTALQKKRKKYEFERHISIAQIGINYIKYFKIEAEEGSRAEDVIKKFNSSVEEWSNQYIK